MMDVSLTVALFVSATFICVCFLNQILDPSVGLISCDVFGAIFGAFIAVFTRFS